MMQVWQINDKCKGKDIAVRNRNHHTATGSHRSWDHTVLPVTAAGWQPGSGDFPAFPAEAGTRFSDPGGMRGWVDLGGGYSRSSRNISHFFVVSCRRVVSFCRLAHWLSHNVHALTACTITPFSITHPTSGRAQRITTLTTKISPSNDYRMK